MSATGGGYFVLVEPCSGELRDRKSRFLALVEPVADADEASVYRQKVAVDHRDATHQCWAERNGWPPVQRCSDAGEPRGTAGEPILRTLAARELSNVVAVVVRWFGGIKLGKGGLARAYSGAVDAALAEARLKRRFPMSAIRIRMAYDRVGAVKHLARARAAEWLSESYGAQVEATLLVRVEGEEAMREALADLRVEVSRPEQDDL